VLTGLLARVASFRGTCWCWCCSWRCCASQRSSSTALPAVHAGSKQILGHVRQQSAPPGITPGGAGDTLICYQASAGGRLPWRHHIAWWPQVAALCCEPCAATAAAAAAAIVASCCPPSYEVMLSSGRSGPHPAPAACCHCKTTQGARYVATQLISLRPMIRHFTLQQLAQHIADGNSAPAVMCQS